MECVQSHQQMLWGQLPPGGSGLNLGCACLENKGLAGFKTGWHLATAGPLPVVAEDVPLCCGGPLKLLSLFAHLIRVLLALPCAIAGELIICANERTRQKRPLGQHKLNVSVWQPCVGVGDAPTDRVAPFTRTGNKVEPVQHRRYMSAVGLRRCGFALVLGFALAFSHCI